VATTRETSRREARRSRERHLALTTPFGSDAFGRRAEAFARFFGTPRFLIGQTVLVSIWIALNAAAFSFRWDPYPFILLNLAFSLQAAYAAPLIVLAQPRQADRDKAHLEADARHREALGSESAAREQAIERLLEANTALTRETRDLAARIDRLTGEIHARVVT
jgi:uncharacterized membrane protein